MYAPVTRSCWDTPSLCSRSVAIFSPSETSWPSLITTYTQMYKSFNQPHTLWLRKTRLAPVTHFSLAGQTLMCESGLRDYHLFHLKLQKVSQILYTVNVYSGLPHKKQ